MLQLIAPDRDDRLEPSTCPPAADACGPEAPAAPVRVSWRDRIAMRIGLWLLLRGCRPRRDAPARRAGDSRGAESALRAHALAVERARAWSAYDAHRGAMNR